MLACDTSPEKAKVRLLSWTSNECPADSYHWPLRFDERWKSEGAPPELVIFVHGWSCFSYPSKKDSAQVGATGTGKTTMLGELIKAKSQYDR